MKQTKIGHDFFQNAETKNQNSDFNVSSLRFLILMEKVRNVTSVLEF